MKWVALGVVAIMACSPRPPPAPIRKTSLGLEIKHVELTNGLKVILIEDPRATEVQVTMRYRVGGVNDPQGQEGMAHLVEHLMFQQVLGGQSLFAQLEATTSSFNGTTTFDATTYTSRAKREHLERLLSVEAVRVGFRCTSITNDTFDREREVVLNELRQRDRAMEVRLAIHRGLYPTNHPYTRSLIGTEETLSSITRDQACAFVDAHYGTRNSVLVVSGDITFEHLSSALQRFVARIGARPLAVAPIPERSVGSRRVDLPAQVASELVVVAWQLPTDPKLRRTLHTVLAAAVPWIDGRVKGRVSLIELGDVSVPVIGVAVALADGESAKEALEGVGEAVANLPSSLRLLDRVNLGDVAFDQIRQTAVYHVFSGLEDGSDRDVLLAAAVLAGRDPRVEIASELEALRVLDRDAMLEIAATQLRMDRASVVVLKPEAATPRAAAPLAVPVHDLGRRDPPDPARAREPIVKELRARGFAAMRTRTLPNGMSVVLLPVASVPTIDMRLVFRAGSADDPQTKIGAGLVAGHGLTWDRRHLNDLLLFVSAGGSSDVEVDADHIAFNARGMDMHLDALLAGLRRWVVEGKYGGDTELITSVLRTEAKRSSDDGDLTDAWRAALYGPRHPYAKVGLVRHVSSELVGLDAWSFRDDYLTPDNATLVIAGGFDPVLADRWIDYLFASWQGNAKPRVETPAVLRPASLAREEAATQTLLRIALPATSKTRASRLVVAEMLAAVVGDVRHQLGASYGLHAYLGDARLAPRYFIEGFVETSRLAEAMELIHRRLEQLRTDPDEAARTFVIARDRVLNRSTSISGRPSTLCDRVVDDVVHGRPPLSDFMTALEVQKLTVAAIDIGEMDLAGGAISMQGPRIELDAAFAVLDRTPTYVTKKARPVIPDPALGRPLLTDRRADYLEMPLTYQGPRQPLSFSLEASYGVGQALNGDISGSMLAGTAALRLDRRTAVAVQLSIGSFEGATDPGQLSTPVAFDIVPIGVAVGLQAIWLDRVRTAAYAGVHFDRLTGPGGSVWTTTAGLNLHVGLDLVELAKRHRLSVFGRIDTAPLGELSFSAFTAGIGYRLSR